MEERRGGERGERGGRWLWNGRAALEMGSEGEGLAYCLRWSGAVGEIGLGNECVSGCLEIP